MQTGFEASKTPVLPTDERTDAAIARTRFDTRFRLDSVEAYHLVVPERTYWNTYQSQDRMATERFLLKPGWRTVYARHLETAIVKVTLDDGAVGWGEATEPICPEVICRLAASLVAPMLAGQAWDHPSSAWDAAYDLQRCRGHGAGYLLHAMAALDVAIFDALARRNGVPLAAFIGSAPALRVTAYLSGIRRASLQERIELLSELVGNGLASAKLFVGNDANATLHEIEGLRRGVPGEWDVMVDALWSYTTVPAAVAARREFGEAGVRWFECPLVPEDLPGHCTLSEGAGAPVALGEHFFTHHQSAPWMYAGALQMFQPDVCRTGISDGLRQAALARESGICVTPHMGSGSPLVQAAALHFAAAAAGGSALCEYQFDLADLLPDTFSSAWTYHGGGLNVPNRPGLCVDVDETALARHSTSVERWRRIL